MRLSEPRVGPLDPSQWDDEQKQVMRRWEPGPISNIFLTLARHPQLLKRWTVFGNHVLLKSTLPERDRELLILRIGWLCRSEYEWGQHVAIGRRAGLSDEEIRRVAEGPEAPGWQPFEAALLRAADELHGDAFIGDATWKQLGERYGTQQLMDVVFTIGQYQLVSMVLNTLGIQREAGVEGFPA